MAMTKCRECEQDVSGRAGACPHCGVKHPDAVQAQRSEQSSYVLVALLCAVAVAVVFLLLNIAGW